MRERFNYQNWVNKILDKMEDTNNQEEFISNESTIQNVSITVKKPVEIVHDRHKETKSAYTAIRTKSQEIEVNKRSGS